MKIFPIKLLGRRGVFLLVSLGLLLGHNVVILGQSKSDDHVPVFLTGVHHLGPNYLIHKFWVNKRIGDNIGRGGGGGSAVCCISLPKKWHPALTADIRWEVDRVVKAADKEKLVTEGIYRAQVPIESYTELGNFYVHFFSEGRVRIVVSEIASDGEQHPIRDGDPEAVHKASTGKPMADIFTQEELEELRLEIDRDRKRYGDWR